MSNTSARINLQFIQVYKNLTRYVCMTVVFVYKTAWKVGIKTKGLKIKIDNMEKVEKTKTAIKNR